jgi:hypothetical protein
MRLLLASLLIVGLSACSTDRESPSSTPTKEPSASPTMPDASASKACAEVRAGIDAFNTEEYANTVAHFRLALPLAKDQARDQPSTAADDLVEAVTYYAELAPEDYAESAISSPEFAKYKAITLGQCSPVGEPSDDGSPGVTA